MVKIVRRENGDLADEHIPAYISMIYKAMYNRAGTYLSSTRLCKSMLQKSSVRFGCRMDAPSSKRYIADFIRNFDVDMADFAKQNFESFNDFFIRALAPGARPIAARSNRRIAVSPADCRMMVFPSVADCQRLWVKSKKFTVDDLLSKQCPTEVRHKLKDCSVMISRLAPHDYHHWHMPVDAKFVASYQVAGALYSVTPAAINSSLNVLGENQRTVYVFESLQFGTVVMVAVGAALVGCIESVSKPGETLRKGDEHGYFKFGGSTVITMFEKGKIEFDNDLLSNSNRPIETLIKMGQSIGKFTSPKQNDLMCQTCVSTVTAEQFIAGTLRPAPLSRAMTVHHFIAGVETSSVSCSRCCSENVDLFDMLQNESESDLCVLDHCINCCQAGEDISHCIA